MWVGCGRWWRSALWVFLLGYGGGSEYSAPSRFPRERGRARPVFSFCQGRRMLPLVSGTRCIPVTCVDTFPFIRFPLLSSSSILCSSLSSFCNGVSWRQELLPPSLSSSSLSSLALPQCFCCAVCIQCGFGYPGPEGKIKGGVVGWNGREKLPDLLNTDGVSFGVDHQPFICFLPSPFAFFTSAPPPHKTEKYLLLVSSCSSWELRNLRLSCVCEGFSSSPLCVLVRGLV